jgi:hypothetical protein
VNTYTVEEARKKECRSGPASLIFEHYPDKDIDWCKVEFWPKCSGSDCMAWLWADDKLQPLTHRRGYCGLVKERQV